MPVPHAVTGRAIASVLLSIVMIEAAGAQPRPYTPQLSCAAVRSIVAQQGRVVLATSPNAYELVYLDSGSCKLGLTAVPAFEPTLDDPNCFAGWRCKDRTNDATGVR